MKTLDQTKLMRSELIAKFLANNPNAADALASVARCEIVFNPKMRTALGRAYYQENKIEMNSRVLSRNPEKYDSTFAHELAHLISYALYGRRGAGHGRMWRSVMRSLGQEPTRCHSIDVSDLKRPHRVIHTAKCGCRTGIEIKTKRANYMAQGRTYKCTRCGQRLMLEVQAPIETPNFDHLKIIGLGFTLKGAV